jgi:hypothetical protein
LSNDDKNGIDFDCTDKQAILDDVLRVIDVKKQLCLDKRWKYKKGDRGIIICDQLEKVGLWVNKF